MRGNIPRRSSHSRKRQGLRNQPRRKLSALEFAWLQSTGRDDKTEADVLRTLERIWKSPNGRELYKNISLPDEVAISIAQEMRVPLRRQATTAFQLQVNLISIETMIPYSQDVDRRALGRVHSLATTMHLELSKLKKRDRLHLYECLFRDEYFSPIEHFEFEIKKELPLGKEPLPHYLFCNVIERYERQTKKLADVTLPPRRGRGRPKEKRNPENRLLPALLYPLFGLCDAVGGRLTLGFNMTKHRKNGSLPRVLEILHGYVPEIVPLNISYDTLAKLRADIIADENPRAMEAVFQQAVGLSQLNRNIPPFA